MKILLIQPKAFKNMTDHVWEPLNLGYIAAYLYSKGYKNVKILPAIFNNDKKILSEAEDADVVGITATSPMMNHGIYLANGIKKLNKKVIIVFGGTHPTVTPETTLLNPNVDVVVRGEGEITFYNLLKVVESNGDFSEVKGISYRRNHKIYHNDNQELISNLDELPFPKRDLFDQEKYIRQSSLGKGKRLLWLLSSRGCPFNCSYCASMSIWTRRWRCRSPENIIKEIKELVHKYQVDEINFADDTFTIDAGRVIKFCRLLEKHKLKIKWFCNARVDTVNLVLLQEMKKAGCYKVAMGVESGSPKILREYKKQISLEQIRKAFEWAHCAGIQTHAYFMIGARGETRDTIRESVKLAKELNPGSVSFTIFTPYPGCEIYEYAKSLGLVKDDMDWSSVDLHKDVTFIPDNMTKEELMNEFFNINQIFETKSETLRISIKDILFILKNKPLSSYFSYLKRFVRRKRIDLEKRIRKKN